MIETAVIDDFLQDYEGFRSHCDNVDFKGETNPVDGVFYPGVSIDIPDYIRIEIVSRIENHLGFDIEPKAMFMRLSPKGVDAPHQAHTDATMGAGVMMLYLNREEHCDGGTSFVSHKETGLCENPVNADEESVWQKDTNSPDAWEIIDMCEMLSNRAIIFDTFKMHRSEPIGGFGREERDARLVLIFFFDSK